MAHQQQGLVNKFGDGVVSGEVYCDRGVYIVKGAINGAYKGNVQLLYRAAEPADLRLSIKGSALPFPNPKIAFGELNSGVAQVDEMGRFAFQLHNPNSYYKNDDIMKGVGQGKILVEPIVFITVVVANGNKKTYEVDLGKGVPLRSLTGLPGSWNRSTGRNTPSYYY